MIDEIVAVVVLDGEGCWLGMLDEDVATTLIAVASEDPADWGEMIACWPRYTTRVVPEFASSLPMNLVPLEQAMSAVKETGLWIVLDLVQKRFLSGREFQLIERNACFAMHTDEKGNQRDPLSIHFPPWWDLHEQVEPDAIEQPRTTPIKVPFVNRDFLFGWPMIEDLTKRIIQLATSEQGAKAFAESKSGERNPFYELTIEVHREWLMTPRDDLNGMFPRQMLHGGIEWLGKVEWGHRIRFERGDDQPIVAVPTSVAGYRDGPVGREEMAIYFDLCRELIGSGWFWCEKNIGDLDEERLKNFLQDVKTEWLEAPLEGGSPPAFVLECSRRRVPRGAGVEIVGMNQRQSEQHVIDCDCPICEMMADGMFGIGFTSIDGHHLELDNEFAFSMCETREEWEKQQREYEEFAAKCDREREERERKMAAGEIVEDEFASAWSGNVLDAPFPGDSGGYMKLAFLLAEIIGELEMAKAPHEMIEHLNADFSSFRKADSTDLSGCADALTVTLETVATQFPSLVPRIADFQSRIAERTRSPLPHSDDDYGDVPF